MDEYAARLLAEHSEVEEIVVFGSFVRGNYAPGSDIDVFLVLAGADKEVRQRVVDYLPGAFPVGIDLFPYTRAEMAERGGSPIIDEVRRSRWWYARRP
jgi:predicted nucleotidyltransferase